MTIFYMEVLYTCWSVCLSVCDLASAPRLTGSVNFTVADCH